MRQESAMAEDSDIFPTSAHDVESILRNKMRPNDKWQGCKVVGPVVTTATSRIFRAFTEENIEPLAVKCASPTEAAEQFDALSKVASILADTPDLGAPAPIALLEANGIVVMDWIDAPSLQSLCLTPLSSATALRNAVARCGKLLARLHRETRLAHLVLDTADFLNDVDLAFGDRSKPEALGPAMELLNATADDVHRLDLPVSVLHGDFKSANLLIDGTTVWTIDAAMKWEGATVHDVAHFLNQFALDLYHPKGLHLRPRLKSLEAAFVSACSDDGLQVSLPALRWLRLQKLITLYAEQFGRTSSRLASWYLLLCLRIEINRIARTFHV